MRDDGKKEEKKEKNKRERRESRSCVALLPLPVRALTVL
jgi:hypothetical protein